MSNRIESELKVAEFLLQIKAIRITPSNPITWASGWKAPLYCDNRKILSYPQIRTYIRQQFVKLISEHYGKPDVIAGVATGGIAMGALIAQELGIPFVYVRPEAKSHGLTNQIEGVITPGQSVVILEDLVSTGKSSLIAVEALKKSGAIIKGMAAVFTYGFAISEDKFKVANCKLITLTNYDILLQQALNTNFIKEDQLDTLKEWRKAPEKWGVEV